MLKCLALCGCLMVANGQTPGRQIDIGAESAPLTDAQRESLAAAVSSHNFANERSVLIAAIASHPQSADLYAVLGRLAFLEKHPGEAASAFEKADELRRLDPKDRETMALSYAFSHDSDKARSQLQRLEREFPSKADYPFMLGRVEEQLGRLEAAIGEYGRAIAIDKNLLAAYHQEGGCQERLGKPEDARKTYEQAVVVNQTLQNRSPWPALDLGALEEESGNLAEAEKHIRNALSQAPNSYQAHYRLGMVLEKDMKNNEALEEFRKAAAANHFYAPAYFALGRIYGKLGKTEEAKQALTRFRELKSEPNHGGSPQN